MTNTTILVLTLKQQLGHEQLKKFIISLVYLFKSELSHRTLKMHMQLFMLRYQRELIYILATEIIISSNVIVLIFEFCSRRKSKLDDIGPLALYSFQLFALYFDGESTFTKLYYYCPLPFIPFPFHLSTIPNSLQLKLTNRELL